MVVEVSPVWVFPVFYGCSALLRRQSYLRLRFALGKMRCVWTVVVSLLAVPPLNSRPWTEATDLVALLAKYAGGDTSQRLDDRSRWNHILGVGAGNPESSTFASQACSQ